MLQFGVIWFELVPFGVMRSTLMKGVSLEICSWVLSS